MYRFYYLLLFFKRIIAGEFEILENISNLERFFSRREWISRQREEWRGKKSVDLGCSKSDVSSNSRLMDLSIPVRVEMKYAGGSLAVATWDDRRPICVRRPEATGALLMRGPDSSLSLRRGSCTWHVQMSSVASLVPSTPDMPADFSPQTSSAQNASSGAPDGFSPFEKSPFDVASKSCRIKRC